MMVREGMYRLIDTLRGMAAAGEDDYTIGSTSYWTDEQVQQALDRHRVDVTRELMTPVEEYSGGTVVWKQYLTWRENWEASSGGTAIFTVQDASGVTVSGSLYSVDYARGVVEFATSTGGNSYYVTGRTYNLNAAAADIWRMKAAHFAGQFSFSTDNMRVDKGALMANAQRMAQYYDGMAGPVTAAIYRSDTDD